ncbi:hypothetical protein FRB94_011659 [Tulasnella sp. JGI-2019a]|nr:hypothetical protein FRB93_001051 [Tulasnella sp. JGI-2019a]KAG9009654.1 hypothetical protein FRB94_011659 [Tulasnella sp. JGI-2019a]KAG9034334.1 hypothetical protein FRB95_013370 [Tulasnella sp. JGI-2019a]
MRNEPIPGFKGQRLGYTPEVIHVRCDEPPQTSFLCINPYRHFHCCHLTNPSSVPTRYCCILPLFGSFTTHFTMTTATFTLPDLVSTCPFPLRCNPNLEPIASESNKWIDGYDIHPNDGHRKAYEACAFGLLVAHTYPKADGQRFRVLCDFINALFAFDDLMDEEHLVRDPSGTKKAIDALMNAFWHHDTHKPGFKLAQANQSFWARAIGIGMAPGTRRRFLEYTDHYCRAVHEQVTNRSKDIIMDVESFTRMRRDTGALKICFVMGEFGLGTDIPDEVFDHPLVKTMENCANDIVVLANDIYSWNIEQAQGHTANIITVLMKAKNLSVQTAMDLVGEEIQKRFRTYLDCKARLPSWGPTVDRDAHAYFTVLEDWSAGNFTWSLTSMRYFGKNAPTIRKSLVVSILPREQKTATDLRNAKEDVCVPIAVKQPKDTVTFILSLYFILLSGALLYLAHRNGRLRSFSALRMLS